MKQQTACPVHGHECHQGLFARNLFVGQRIPLAGVAHQNGTIRFGDDPEDLRARPQLQGARSGQPVRGGRQLLPVERRGQSGADDHGQRAARGRSPDREDELMMRRSLPVSPHGRGSVGRHAIRWSPASIRSAITVSDLDRSVEFYSKVLNFEKVSEYEVAGEGYEHLEGVFGFGCGPRACDSARNPSN